MRFTLEHAFLAAIVLEAVHSFALLPRPHSAARTAVARQSLADFEERARELKFEPPSSTATTSSSKPLDALAAPTEALQRAQQTLADKWAELASQPTLGAAASSSSGSNVVGAGSEPLHNALQGWVHSAVAWANAVPPAVPTALCLAVCVDAFLLNGALRNGLFSPGSLKTSGATSKGKLGQPAWASGVALSLDEPEPNPYTTNGRYNPQDAAEFFAQRPAMVASRAATIATISSGFGLSLLIDQWQGKFEERQPERAAQLVELLTTLGPTFIKVGQSLSIRSDLLPLPYLEALSTLQDRVPAFDTSDAKAILARELGRPVNEVFSEFSSEPVAAASLGQVYKAKLRPNTAFSPTLSSDDGDDGSTSSGNTEALEVAVKVQRPGITSSVALDMHLIRSAGPVIKAVFGLQSDVVGTVDDWGLGFVDELDYTREAANAQRFTASLANTPLKGAVFAPEVVSSASSKRILTTEWVAGERLELSSSGDVNKLCGLCMNTYLTMLLETGMLHCDPHPGNLLRTPDGRLCILDWGLVTEIAPNLQLDFITHVAHLTSKDYAKVPADLVALGFVPNGKEDAIQQTEAVEVLTSVYSQFAGGGGAAKIDVASVVNSLSGLSATYGNLFQLPPYFAYIARAFGVLEGIGLSNDPNYAIVSECLPYVSQRLLTDPKVGEALDNFVFGAAADDPDRVLDAERLELIFDGVTSYSASTAGLKEVTDPDAATSSTSTSSSGAAAALPSEFSALADTFADVLLTSEPTPVQTLLLDQLAKVTAALGRQAFSMARQQSGPLGALVNAPIPGLGSSSSSSSSSAGNTPRSLLGALVDPLGMFRGSGVVDMDEQDQRALAAAAKLSELLAASPYAAQAQSLTPQDLLAVAQEVVPRLWARRLGVAQASGRFAGVLLEQQARRLEKRRNPTPPAAAAADTVASSTASTTTAFARSSAGTSTVTAASGAAAVPRPPPIQQPPAPSPRLEKARLLLAEN